MDNLQNFRRTGYCGTFTAANIGQEIAVCGWVQRQRNLGGLIFVDLRDRTGLLQLSFDDSTPRDLFEKAASLRGEYVIAAKGLVRERESKNPDLPTGDIEVKVTELRLLAKAALRDRGELRREGRRPAEVPLPGPPPAGYAADDRPAPQDREDLPGLL